MILVNHFHPHFLLKVNITYIWNQLQIFLWNLTSRMDLFSSFLTHTRSISVSASHKPLLYSLLAGPRWCQILIFAERWSCFISREDWVLISINWWFYKWGHYSLEGKFAYVWKHFFNHDKGVWLVFVGRTWRHKEWLHLTCPCAVIGSKHTTGIPFLFSGGETAASELKRKSERTEMLSRA